MGAMLRVGLVGVGWGALVHAPAFRAVAGYQLVALCATRPESVARASERPGVSDTSTDWKSFVRRDDLDLISISAPVPFHREMTLAALDAGKHVLCEKPLAMNGDECLDMVLAAERSDRATAVCFENRWSPERLAIRELAEGGAPGPCRLCRQPSEDWLPAFDGAPTSLPSLRDGWRVQQIIDAALRSSDGGGWVDIEQTK